MKSFTLSLSTPSYDVFFVYNNLRQLLPTERKKESFICHYEYGQVFKEIHLSYTCVFKNKV